jgi:nucleoside-diphosphate-sugar epimerase
MKAFLTKPCGFIGYHLVELLLDQGVSVIIYDVAIANILAATLSNCILQKHQIFNIGTGSKTNILELLDLISKLTEYYLEPIFLPSREGEIKHSCAEIILGQEKLGFNPLISLEEGIKLLL